MDTTKDGNQKCHQSIYIRILARKFPDKGTLLKRPFLTEQNAPTKETPNSPSSQLTWNMRRTHIERCNSLDTENSRAITNNCDIGDEGALEARPSPRSHLTWSLRRTHTHHCCSLDTVLSHHNQLPDWRRGGQRHLHHQTCSWPDAVKYAKNFHPSL